MSQASNCGASPDLSVARVAATVCPHRTRANLSASSATARRRRPTNSEALQSKGRSASMMAPFSYPACIAERVTRYVSPHKTAPAEQGGGQYNTDWKIKLSTQTTTAVIPFTYGDAPVRTVVIDGEPWFVLADLCAVLDLANVGNVADRLDEVNIRRTDVENTRGQMRQTIIVSEPGMYEVVIRSDKPEAAVFRRWITGTVLPEIRRTGSFNATPAMPAGKELLALAVLEAQSIITAKDEQIALLAAPARSWTLLADAAGDFSVAEAAKILSRDPAIATGRDRLFQFMADRKWIFKSRNSRGGWEAYQTAVDTSRLAERPAKPFLNSKTGAYELPAPTIRISAKGIGKLHELLGGTDPIRFVVAEESA